MFKSLTILAGFSLSLFTPAGQPVSKAFDDRSVQQESYAHEAVGVREGNASGVQSPIQAGGGISGVVNAREIVWHRERVERAIVDNNLDWGFLVEQRITPLPGMHVHLDRLPGVGSEGGTFRQSSIESDQEGTFFFASLSPGQYELSVFPAPEGSAHLRPEMDRQGRRRLQIMPDQTTQHVELTFDLTAVACTGQLRDAQGHPVAKAQIIAVPLNSIPPDGDDGFDRIQGARIGSHSDAEGRFHVEGMVSANVEEILAHLQGGVMLPWNGHTYAVQAHAEGFAPAQVIVPAIPPEIVRFYQAVVEARQKHPETIREDADNGILAINAAITGYLGPENTLTGLELVLHPAARVAGRLLDSTGAHLKGVRLRLRPGHAPERRAFTQEAVLPEWVLTEENGFFEFLSVPPGDYHYEVKSEAGLQRARNPLFHVATAEIIEGVEVVVESAAERGSIEGHILTETSAPAPPAYDLRVESVRSSVESSPHLGILTQDKATGAFRISGVTAGTALLSIRALQFADQRLEVEVHPGQVSSLDVILAPEARIRGKAMRNGMPSAYGYVTLEDVEQYSQTSEQGQYDLGGLQAGRYLMKTTMWVYEDRRGGAQLTDRRWVDLTEGKTRELDITYEGHASITGNFTGPEDTDWRVHVLDERLPGDDKLRYVTWKFKRKGRYEIEDLAPGNYVLIGVCRRGEDVVAEQRTSIAIVGNESVTWDFDLNGVNP